MLSFAKQLCKCLSGCKGQQFEQFVSYWSKKTKSQSRMEHVQPQEALDTVSAKQEESAEALGGPLQKPNALQCHLENPYRHSLLDCTATSRSPRHSANTFEDTARGQGIVEGRRVASAYATYPNLR